MFPLSNPSELVDPLPAAGSRQADPIDPPPLPHHRIGDAVATAAAWVVARPWLTLVAVVLAAAVVVARSVVRARSRWAMREHARLVTIAPPPQVDPAGGLGWWATLVEVLAPVRWRRWLHGTPHFGWEYRWSGRAMTIAVWVPGGVAASQVAAEVRGAWPGAAVTVTDPTPPVPGGGVAAGGVLAPRLPAWYPLRTDHDTDPLRPLIAAMTQLRDHEHGCVQILARPATPRQQRRLRRGVASLRTGVPATSVLDPNRWLSGLLGALIPGSPVRTGQSSRQVPGDPERERDARGGLDKLAYGQLWQVAIRYGLVDTNPRHRPPEQLRPRLRGLAHAVAAAYGVYSARQRLHRSRLRHPQRTLATRAMPGGFLLSALELAGLATLPQDLAVPGMSRARAKPMPAPVEVPTGGRGLKVLGRAQVGGHSVALPVADARQHLHVLGATGVGKSTFLANLILDDIAAYRGVVVIDPKGDLVTDLLDRIPATLADRVALIDPDQPAGARFNPLSGDDDHDLVVDNIVSIFSRIFQRHWGPRIDDTLRVALLTIMRHANPMLTLVPPLLNDKHFRARFTQDLDDPEGLLGFWTWYESMPAAVRAQVIGPVNARLRAFLLRDFPRRTLGVPDATFDMRRVLDQGGILLARLPKGQLGEDTARLMGSLILARAWQAATARARQPEPKRRDATVVIDECHNFLNLPGSVDDMLAEARGYHLSLVLAHQHLGQLPADTQLALSANARNKVLFNIGPEDARNLARHTFPELEEHDLSHLDAFQAAARLMIGNRETAAFTMSTRPPRPPVGETTALRAAIAADIPPPPKKTPYQQLARHSASLTHQQPPGNDSSQSEG